MIRPPVPIASGHPYRFDLAGDSGASGHPQIHPVSLDGPRLAVGAVGDDGAVGGGSYEYGAVYLFSFSDLAFTGGQLEGVIGSGYQGANDIDIALDQVDYFGSAVSLDDTRLAVGAYADDGVNNGTINAGSVYLFSFSDLAFNGGALEGIVGEGYSGSKSINVQLDSLDYFGSAVALSDTGLIIGAFGDDGATGSIDDAGAVYLFTFSDDAFNSGRRDGVIGSGYVGDRNVDVGLDSFDYFGGSVSLDGTRLAVGARGDDGATGGTNDAGAVYLFSFSDLAFNGGQLKGIIGNGYTSTKTLNIGLDADDYFGWAVSLDGTRLAVGAPGDDGATGGTGNAGAVYLFSFSDLAFNGGILEGVIGNGYTGGKNVDVGLDSNDFFGSSVSLDGTRLAVGAYLDDGAINGTGNAGAVYLFSFSDLAFNGGILEGVIGNGYTGGKNVDVGLDSYKLFGRAVSLDGTRLAVGAYGDDGATGGTGSAGAVYLFSFSDLAFNGGILEAVIGNGYTSGKDINVGLDSGDEFGKSVSLDGTRLAAGAPGDDGAANGTNNAGAVYLFSFSDLAFNGGILEAVIGNGYTGGKNVDVGLDNSDEFGYSVSLYGTRLAVGDYLDDGATNGTSAAGAVYLFSFSDLAFNGGILESNGTESNMLKRSLERALQKDAAGRRITNPFAGPLFSGVEKEEDLASGTVYVLRSKSDLPFVQEHREVLHKIGVTGGKLERRFANAKSDPTFLMADVEVVASYQLYNINRTKLENLIHRIFEPARLSVEIKDRFGKPVVPREWFMVPLSAIDQAVEKIKSGAITKYVYDPARAQIILREVSS